MNQDSQKSIAYLALGSNLGERLEALRGARSALDQEPELAVLGSSALYETEPIGGPCRQGPYLNAVLKVATALDSLALLQVCLAVENRFGRRRQERWGARTLDIDLLFYQDQVRDDPVLTLPHPRLHQRAFVLAPLCDLDPLLEHPGLGRTVENLLNNLEDDQGVCRLRDTW